MRSRGSSSIRYSFSVSFVRRSWCVVPVLGLALSMLALAVPRAQSDARQRALDEVLDLYVRDGEVYYHALKLERAKLDAFVNALANVQADKLARDDRLAFWLNAYNALVLQTVIDHYPIQKRSSDYPAKSIRQIPGAFERLPHRAGGRTVTLDQIEQTILPEFHDPRVYLAIGRGAQGSGRLRSEAFTGQRLETQLAEAAAECATRDQCLKIDREGDTVGVSSIFSWREKEFVAAYAEKAPPALASRSPIERAVLGMLQSNLLTIEKEALAKNTFRLTYIPFDWTLNDLTGRGGR
jgi:Protein of unknown function, DUF547